ncbi:MAG: V-type ATP synthase subunit A [Defluviitaleaceae bacterium]|nr:V-type ATP synthase subunit A [Defluviitaleaceae bacterium]
MKTGAIFGINGPVLTVIGGIYQMSEMVKIGEQNLTGEVIFLQADKAIIQAFEDTAGLKPGEPVEGTGQPLSASLGPGLLGNIFDGIQRPLKEMGLFMPRGVHVDNLDVDKPWEVRMFIKAGDYLSPGAIIAEVQETPAIIHRIMIPPEVAGDVSFAVTDGKYTITDTLATVGSVAITMTQSWPIRIPRPASLRKTPHLPLITGQRVIDTFFPIAKGGTAAIPGGFGTGKTITQHQLAKWSDADIIVYIGCGERGNEMTEVLEDFSKLTDPRTGHALMDRTVLIANTSNMPVAAREASIYTGITIAEYYRDMGYHVAIMADSTSRWAEALRELSGRLEEMPAEEGYPAYLASRLAGFYERAGYVEALSGQEGSVTIVGAVSPQGADFSEPVTQHTKRFVRCFWALDRALAYERHFPAIHWLSSYSDYKADLSEWYAQEVSPDFEACRDAIFRILYEESQLQEIVKLIGADVLPKSQQLILEIAQLIRLTYLQQNAYHPDDACVPLEKQLKMMRKILKVYEERKSHAI